MRKPDEDIPRQRELIDELDRHIVGLLNERAEHALRIRRAKNEAGAQILDAERESEIYDKIALASDGPLSGDDLRRIYERVLEVMRTFG
ncbi:MAG: chorismate mutase [Actinobacteria bacterium]|nr:MAG: chorismate mutase [Actinomycetota bacterium]